MHTRIALLGKDISYSLSEKLHTWSAHHLGLKNVVYEILDLQAEELSGLSELLEKKKVSALNITTPYKTLIRAALDAQVVSGGCAWNLGWQNSQGLWQLANTDGAGFIACLQRRKMLDIQHWAFLGFGGAVKGVLEYIFSQHAYIRPVHIFWHQVNSSVKSSWREWGGGKESSDGNFPVYLHPFSHEKLGEVLKDLRGVFLSQATPLPHQGDDLHRFAQVSVREQRSLVGFLEMTYGAPSALLSQLKKEGTLVVDGTEMLVEQALLSQQVWWGQQAPRELLLEHLRKGHGFI